MPVTIRPVTAADRPVWVELFDAYAAFYKTSVSAEGKAAQGAAPLGHTTAAVTAIAATSKIRALSAVSTSIWRCFIPQRL